jgi:nanoRNase/pAp phosphatase (c-di-AMP/oligoRNAs hydrolase)
MTNTTNHSSRSDRFLQALAGHEQILVVTHDNPDPDAVAAGWGLYCLVKEKLAASVRLVGGGEIMRAENRQMMKLLQPPLELVDCLVFPKNAALVLVDCSAASQNHLLACDRVGPVAVIDHHRSDHCLGGALWEDIRPSMAASASIVASYLREQKLTPNAGLATAMLYALRTETRGAEVHFSRLDRRILLWLTDYADPSLLAQIENAPLAPEYFGDMALAIQSTILYGDTALCLLPRAHGPEIVGEVADLLIRCEGVRRVLCGAIVHDDIVLSVRTAQQSDENAAELVRQTLVGLGHGGGHRHRAGGKIPGLERGPIVLDLLQTELLSRWLATCGIDRLRGQHLVARHEIMENL